MIVRPVPPPDPDDEEAVQALVGHKVRIETQYGWAILAVTDNHDGFEIQESSGNYRLAVEPITSNAIRLKLIGLEE